MTSFCGSKLVPQKSCHILKIAIVMKTNDIPQVPIKKRCFEWKIQWVPFFFAGFPVKRMKPSWEGRSCHWCEAIATTFNDTLHLSRVKLCAAAEDGSVWKLMFRMIRMNEADGRLLGSQSVSWSISSFGWTVHTGFFSTSFDGPTKTIGYHSKSMHQQRYGKWFIPFLSHILQVYLYQ